MIRGLMASRLGMAVEQTRTDVLANNVTNVNTNGFKRSATRVDEFGPMLLQRLEDPADPQPPLVGVLGNGVQVDQIIPDLRQGDLRQTTNPLDVAFQGPGEFAVQGPGGIAYTRNGAFHQNQDGSIATADGRYLMVRDPAGQVVPLITPGAMPQIEADGSVLVDGQTVGLLEVRGTTPETVLRSGYLEASNVDMAQETAELIMALRSYQVNQRALQMQDGTLAKAVTEIGKV